MADTLLINRDDIMKLTGVSGNIDPDRFYPHIKTSQDIHLQPILGTQLYKKLLTIVGDGTWTDVANADYKELIDDYVTPMLVYYTMVDFIPFQLYQMQNGGIFRNTTNNSITAENNDIFMLAGAFKDKAEFYVLRTNDYLCNNTSNFPEYNTNTAEDIDPNTKSGTFQGWHI